MLQTQKLISKKRPQDNRQVYVAIDFEAIDTDIWWTFSAVVTNFPEGHKIEQFTIGVDRNKHEIQNTSIRDFWSKHSEAFAINKEIAGKVSEETAENNLVQYILDLKTRFQNFFLITDNPAFDVRLLDNILAKHGQKSMSIRNGEYFQAIDTWSYRLATMQLLGFRSHELSRLHNTLQRPVRPITCFVNDSNHRAHTPMYDASVLTSQYFKVKDIVASRRRQQHYNRQSPEIYNEE
jgi:hypothetical protein